MAKHDVLDRVAADLARGRTQPAIQRLSSLIAAHPTDLELRRRLAALHRMVGNRIEAGRWDYLTPGADRDDVTAFERAIPAPGPRLAALRWPHRAGAAATEYARSRLETLMLAALAEGRISTPPTSNRLGAITAIVIAGLLLTIAGFGVLGAVTVVQWIIP